MHSHISWLSGLACLHLCTQWQSPPCVYARFPLIKMGSMLCSGTNCCGKHPWCVLAGWIAWSSSFSENHLDVFSRLATTEYLAWFGMVTEAIISPGSLLASKCVWADSMQEDQTNPTSCSFCKTTGPNASKYQCHFFKKLTVDKRRIKKHDY